jgi:serine/threonine protein kinase
LAGSRIPFYALPSRMTSTDPPTENLEGQSIGPWRIQSLLAVGGMGRVYKAQAPGGEAVALKLIKPDLARDLIFRKRFDREARIAERVKHPHLVPVLDAGEHGGVPYLAQQFIGGGTLADKIEKDGPLDLPTLVRVCREVAGGLDALHEHALFHRDVKPANILLDEGGVAYLTDFGLAKDTQGSLLTRPGQALGSLDYMAPEQIRSEEVSAATDVYALGCVMCECVAGKPPFADRQGMRVLWAHLQDAPPDPCADRSDLPAELGPVILSALEKDPAARPQSASAYAEALQAAAGL